MPSPHPVWIGDSITAETMPQTLGFAHVKHHLHGIPQLGFQRREQVIHAASVKRWVEKNRSASQPVQPLLQIPPLLASTADIPHEVTATLTISPAGTVSDVELSRRLPDPADETVRTTLNAWLFLPKIQDGVATTARVTVPLNF